MKFLTIIALFLFVTFVQSHGDEELEARLAMENPDLFLGDIIEFDADERNVIPKEKFRWPDKTIPYVIDEQLKRKTNLIQSAMDDYHNKTCVKFVPRTDEKNYIKIFLGKGCYSAVGMINRGEQPVSLGIGCHYKGTVVHELGHTVGFYHEQNRSDRNKYLKIYWEHIIPGAEPQFVLLYPKQNLLLNKFNYDSIMIYGNYAFSSRDKILKTMVAKNKQPLYNPNLKEGLTDSDAERVNKMYNC